MSQNFKLREPTIKAMQIKGHVGAGDILDFVGNHATVLFSSAGIAIAFKTEEHGVDDIISLDHMDYLVFLAGELAVYTEESFENNFEAV